MHTDSDADPESYGESWGSPIAPPGAPVQPLTGGAPDELELRVLRALRRIIQAVDIHSRKLAGEYRITGPQLVTLLAITEHGPITPSRIADRVHLSSSTVVGILDRLESKGLVLRERSREDRRNVYVTATGAGVQLARSAPSPLQDTLSRALRRLPDLERAAIGLSLERIVELIDAEHIDAAPLLETGSLKQSSSENIDL